MIAVAHIYLHPSKTIFQLSALETLSHICWPKCHIWQLLSNKDWIGKQSPEPRANTSPAPASTKQHCYHLKQVYFVLPGIYKALEITRSFGKREIWKKAACFSNPSPGSTGNVSLVCATHVDPTPQKEDRLLGHKNKSVSALCQAQFLWKKFGCKSNSHPTPPTKAADIRFFNWDSKKEKQNPISVLDVTHPAPSSVLPKALCHFSQWHRESGSARLRTSHLECLKVQARRWDRKDSNLARPSLFLLFLPSSPFSEPFS